MKMHLCACFVLFSGTEPAQKRQYEKQERNAAEQSENYVFRNSCNDIGDKAAARNCQSIRKLCCYMVYMIALRACGCHDRGV